MISKNTFYSIIVVLLFYFLLSTLSWYFAPSNGVSAFVIGGADDGNYYRSEALKEFAGGYNSHRFNVHIIVLIFKIFGSDNLFMVRMFNLFALLMLYIVMNKLIFQQVKLLGITADITKKAKKKLLLFFLSYNSLIFCTTWSINRDIWIYLFFVCSCYFFIKFYFNKKKIYLPLMIGSIFILSKFRPYIAVSFTIGIIVFLIYSKMKKNNNFNIIFCILANFILVSLFVFFFQNIQILKSMIYYRESGIDNFLGHTSNFGVKLNLNNPILCVFDFTVSFLYNSLGLAIFNINNVKLLLFFFVEAIPLSFISYYLLKNKELIDPKQLFLFFEAIIWFDIVTLINDNLGTAARLRVSSWLILVVTAIVVFMKKKILKNIDLNQQVEQE